MNNIKPLSPINCNNKISFGKNRITKLNSYERYNSNKNKSFVKPLISIAVVSIGAFALIKSGKLNGIGKNLKHRTNNFFKKITDKTKNNANTLNINLTIKKQPEAQNIEVSLKDVTFKKGFARTIDGQNFSGTITHTFENNDKIELTYLDGIIQKSVKKGEDGFVKTYTPALITTKYNNGGSMEMYLENSKPIKQIIKNRGDVCYAEKTYGPSGYLEKNYMLINKDASTQNLPKIAELDFNEDIEEQPAFLENVIKRIKNLFSKKNI